MRADVKAAAKRALRRARARIARGWCQYAQARRGNDVRVKPWDVTAQRWCLFGALDGADRDDAITLLKVALPEAYRELPLWAWNDQPKRTQRQVLALIDRAIGGK